jgi:hypothetical protein
VCHYTAVELQVVMPMMAAGANLTNVTGNATGGTSSAVNPFAGITSALTATIVSAGYPGATATASVTPAVTYPERLVCEPTERKVITYTSCVPPTALAFLESSAQEADPIITGMSLVQAGYNNQGWSDAESLRQMNEFDAGTWEVCAPTSGPGSLEVGGDFGFAIRGAGWYQYDVGWEPGFPPPGESPRNGKTAPLATELGEGCTRQQGGYYNRVVHDPADQKYGQDIEFVWGTCYRNCNELWLAEQGDTNIPKDNTIVTPGIADIPGEHVPTLGCRPERGSALGGDTEKVVVMASMVIDAYDSIPRVRMALEKKMEEAMLAAGHSQDVLSFVSLEERNCYQGMDPEAATRAHLGLDEEKVSLAELGFEKRFEGGLHIDRVAAHLGAAGELAIQDVEITVKVRHDDTYEFFVMGTISLEGGGGGFLKPLGDMGLKRTWISVELSANTAAGSFQMDKMHINGGFLFETSAVAITATIDVMYQWQTDAREKPAGFIMLKGSVDFLDPTFPMQGLHGKMLINLHATEPGDRIFYASVELDQLFNVYTVGGCRVESTLHPEP